MVYMEYSNYWVLRKLINTHIDSGASTSQRSRELQHKNVHISLFKRTHWDGKTLMESYNLILRASNMHMRQAIVLWNNGMKVTELLKHPWMTWQQNRNATNDISHTANTTTNQGLADSF